MWRVVVSFFLLFFISFSPLPAHAQEMWQIDHFQSDIAIQNTGEVRIVETIQADFGTLAKHGIYRDIPYIYQADGQEFYTDIHISSVLQNRNKAKYIVTKQGGYVRIKIGDANRTISGKITYTITYVAKGVLRNVGDYDELYWNVTGTWPVGIRKVDATITLDQPAIERLVCYEGQAGGTNLCSGAMQSKQVGVFSNINPLAPYQQMTIAAAYQKGMVPILMVERPKTFWERFIAWPSLSTLLSVIFAGLLTVLYRWNRFGRDYWFGKNIFAKSTDEGSIKPIGAHETITVEFLPPKKMRPAEMGVLMDERADTTDVVATIIDLATRGYLSITEIPKKWLFGKVDYQLQTKNKDTSELLAYEKKLLDNLFKTGDSVTVSALKTTFYEGLKQVKNTLYADVVAKKLYPVSPEEVRSQQFVIGIILFFVAVFLLVVSANSDFVFGFDIALGCGVSSLLFCIMAKFMPRRTAYGRELYRRTKGYRLFITTAETHRQKFFENKNMFNEVLPYAIVFGVVDKFAQQMKAIGITPTTTTWYSGQHAFSTNTFASSMNDFSQSLGSAMASTPSSSGGFSGGSSGGGFGGGGGGSW